MSVAEREKAPWRKNSNYFNRRSIGDGSRLRPLSSCDFCGYKIRDFPCERRGAIFRTKEMFASLTIRIRLITAGAKAFIFDSGSARVPDKRLSRFPRGDLLGREGKKSRVVE